MPLEYVRHDKIRLRTHPEFNEAWVLPSRAGAYTCCSASEVEA